MWLENLKVRVKKYPKGWAVEIERTKTAYLFFKVKRWEHLISVSGMSDEPWFYDTKERAISQAVKLFEWDLLIGTRDYQ